MHHLLRNFRFVKDPVELPEEPEPSEGPSVPFRLTEAKLGHEQIGDQPYFGRLNLKARHDEVAKGGVMSHISQSLLKCSNLWCESV